MKLNFKTIYLQEAINENPIWKANADAILARFPQAAIVPVPSHWQIDSLFGADPSEWMHTKQDNLVLGVRRTLKHTVNGRSANYIAASMSNGCLSSCQYCYVARRKGGSNPLTLFMNTDQILNSIRRHSEKLGPKTEPDQCDPRFWTYDLGCNADLSADALVCDLPGQMVAAFATMPYAKATFATKTVNDDFWLRYDPQGKTRIRYSVTPQKIARYVDIGTSRIADRLASVNKLVEGGYEVHLNFSPIIIYEGDQWKADWVELFQEIDDVLSPAAKQQLMSEVFFLTHSAELHAINMQWNPKGEEFLWSPKNQVPKKSAPELVVYDYKMRQRELQNFTTLLNQYLPYCTVRYSF
ncbi:MAG: spore photoproduct lyase family protein [Caldilinea sp. CFX5]|nr:spore photoproduct lyase family protein [Caldilinea sp. CFX5]